jgi:hypothetical protein
MKFERGSFLKQEDYKSRSQIGLVAASIISALILIVAFVVPLLK